LVVRVRARAIDGAANTAVIRAVAAALGVRPRDVTLVRGRRSREKHLAVDGEPSALLAAASQLQRERDA
jgi:uncharacterized protein YggU (UPF0235/DUF167 family)